jgi:transcriptional regulator with XRE-family HTH domain
MLVRSLPVRDISVVRQVIANMAGVIMDSTWLRQRLRELRKRCGLTQEELGQRAHLSKQFISDVERGAKGLSVESFLRYVRGLGISPLVVFEVDVHPFVGLVRGYAELPPWKQQIFLNIVVPALIELLKASTDQTPMPLRPWRP